MIYKSDNLRQMPQQTYVFHLSGAIKPKARPRCACTRGKPRLYHSDDYREWKARATHQLAQQAWAMGLREPISHPVRLFTWFFGKHSRRADYIDNAPGAIADALVETGAWANDNGSNGQAANYELFWGKGEPETFIALAPRRSKPASPAEAFAEAQEQTRELWEYVRGELAVV